MDDLVQFLRDRYDDHESAALGAKGSTSGRWTQDDGPPEDIVLYDKSGKLTFGQARHIARHDPARVLAEVEAKRQLLAAILGEGHAMLRPGGSTAIYCDADYGADGRCECGRDERVDRLIRLLALPYTDHPAYREEWRP